MYRSRYHANGVVDDAATSISMSAAAVAAGSSAAADAEAVAGALAALTSAARSPASIAAACNQLAAAAAADDHLVEASVAGDCVPHLISALGEHGSVEDVAIAACRLLHVLATGGLAAEAASSIAAIVAALCVHVDSDAVAEPACGTLWHLTFASDANVDAIAAAGGIAPVVAALRRHVSNPAVAMAACGAIGRLAFVDPAYAVAVADAGAGSVVRAGHSWLYGRPCWPFTRATGLIWYLQVGRFPSRLATQSGLPTSLDVTEWMRVAHAAADAGACPSGQTRSMLFGRAASTCPVLTFNGPLLTSLGRSAAASRSAWWRRCSVTWTADGSSAHARQSTQRQE